MPVEERLVLFITLALLSNLCGHYCQGTVDCNKLMLEKDDSYNGTTTIRSLYHLANIEGVPRSLCSYNCLLLTLDCAGVLYHEKERSCTLLKCHINDKLTINSTVGGALEYWANSKACKEGWVQFASHCYYFSETEASWNEAVNVCTTNGSYLIEMNSFEEVSWAVESFMPSGPDVPDQCSNMWDCTLWVGARYRSDQNKFMWNRSSEEIIFPEWELLQPNNFNGKQQCVGLQRNGKANDLNCKRVSPFVCENESNCY